MPDQPETAPAEDGVGGLIGDGPEVPVTRAREDDAGETKRPKLPVDGSFLDSRLCRIYPDPESGWVMVEVLSDGKRRQPARWALPSRMLAKMEEEIRKTPHAVFRISGENTVYDKRCFILITKASLRPPAATQPAITIRPATQPATSRPRPVIVTTQPATRPSTQPSTQPTTQPSTRPTTQPSSRPKPVATAPTTQSTETKPATTGQALSGPAALPEATADDIMAELRKDTIGPRIEPRPAPGTDRPNRPEVAPLPNEKTLSAKRGTFVVDRLVNVLPVGLGRWMEARFVSDNTLREPPLRLLPCRMLRRAELLVAGSRKGQTPQLRVSGVITYYKGRRFLLLRKAIQERGLDRF